MSPKVLAFIENNIGMRLLLATRLRTLGYRVTILSTADAFRQRIAVEAFDWIILDAAAVPARRARFLEDLARHAEGTRIVWLGELPRRRRVPIEATFAKPLVYDQITQFFSGRALSATRPSVPPNRGEEMGAPPGQEPRGQNLGPLSEGRRTCERRTS